jgi:uroporphyrinogen-III synthase
VSTIEVYRTRFLEADVSGLTTWLGTEAPVAVAFFSPSGAAGLERLLPERTRAAIHERAAAIARGPTTAKALNHYGYRHVFSPSAGTTFDEAAHEALLSACGEKP